MIVEFWGHEFKINILLGCIGGFLIAVVSSMFGFGGGPFMVPLMTVGLGLPMYVVVGSSLLAIFFNTLMGTTRHYMFGNFDCDVLSHHVPGRDTRRLHRTADRKTRQPPRRQKDSGRRASDSWRSTCWEYIKLLGEMTMIDTSVLLDDVAFAKAILEKKELSNADIVFSLRNLLRMKYYPVAVKFFFSEE